MRAPKRAHNSLTRAAPICVTAICAWMSPRISAGCRLLARMMRSISVCATPPSTILIGGSSRPSWNISVALAEVEPATAPPTSALCAIEPAKATSLAGGENRRDERHVGDVRQAAVIGMIGDEHVALLDPVAFVVAAMEFENAADQMAIDRRVEEHRRRHDQPPVAVEDHAAEVARLADDGRIAGAIEMVVHLIDQARDLVAQDLDGDGIHAHALARMRLR